MGNVSTLVAIKKTGFSQQLKCKPLQEKLEQYGHTPEEVDLNIKKNLETPRFGHFNMGLRKYKLQSFGRLINKLNVNFEGGMPRNVTSSPGPLLQCIKVVSNYFSLVEKH